MKVKKIFKQKNTIFKKKFNLTPLYLYNGLPQVIVSNQKGESISIQRVKQARAATQRDHRSKVWSGVNVEAHFV